VADGRNVGTGIAEEKAVTGALFISFKQIIGEETVPMGNSS